MKTLALTLLLAAVLFSPSPVNAQADNEVGVGEQPQQIIAPAHVQDWDQLGDLDHDPLNNGTQQPLDAPIDGGLAVLLVAGAAYGAKRIASAKGK